VPDIDTFDPGKKTGDCIPLFHYEQREDPVASEEAGHPVFGDVEYVEIIAPGNDKEVINRAVTKADKERWPRQYEAFKNKEKVEYEGTPINQWPQVTMAQAKTLEAMHIYTVEQLSEMADQNLSGMGMRDLKNKAIAYLEWQAGESSVQKYAQKNRRLEERSTQQEEEIKQLQEQIKALGKLVEGHQQQDPLEEPKKKGRFARK